MPPAATVTGERGRLVVVTANLSAAEYGVAPGMPLADARALFPGLAVAEADAVGEAQALERLARWAVRYSPWTAVEHGTPPGTGGVWLDVSGCAHLFGGEAALIDDLLTRVRARGFAAQAAIADTPGAAWAWARHRPREDDAILPEGSARAALANLPAAALRLEAEVVEALDRLGLRRIGLLYDLPRAALTARFSDIVSRRVDQALGVVEEPISPERPVAPLIARLAFPEPVTQPADLPAALERLLDDLCRRLAAEHLGARRLDFSIHRSDGSLDSVGAGVSHPSRDPRHLMTLMAPKLEGLDPAGVDGHSGVEVAVLAMPAVSAFSADQKALSRLRTPAFANVPSTPDQSKPNLLPAGFADTNLAALADRLVNRLGRANVFHMVCKESHWPERAVATHPVLDGPPPAGARPAAAPGRRPLRLLDHPEPVETTAVVDTQGHPAAFRWRKLVHVVANAEGPERIEPEWWRGLTGTDDRPPLGRPLGDRETARDYYKLEDREGRRFWLFRETTEAAETAVGPAARWYLHGVFA